MISVDGLSPDLLRRAAERDIPVPHLSRLIAEGFLARLEGVLPSVTYPSHTTLVTGVSPRLHGVASNKVFDPLERSAEAWNWYASQIEVESLPTALAAAGRTSGAVSWPVSVGAAVTWNVPEYWRTGSSHPLDLELLRAISTPPGLLAAFEAARGAPLPYPFGDAERAEIARHVLTAHRPDLLLLHLFELDTAAHDHGPDAPEVLAALAESDRLVGSLLAAVDEAEAATLVAIVSDHGFLPVATRLKPNVLLREAGLVRLSEDGDVEAWRAFFQADGGTAALHLAAGEGGELEQRVAGLFRPLAERPGSGVRAILGREEIAALGGTAQAALVIEAESGFHFSHDPRGEWSEPTDSRGHHGFDPRRPEMHAALIIAAPGLDRQAAGTSAGPLPMTRVAPSVARWLGVELDPRAAPPLPGVPGPP